jgi:glycosyltransferase involved in cell wall biosynthesis
LRSEGVDVQALVTGGEPDAKLKQRLEYAGLDRYVTFAGYVALDRLKELLQTLDVFVVPSHQEGLCIAALQAMACGCPVVSTRCGGPEEFVIDGETGYLVDSDSDQMAAAIRTTINNPGERDRMGINACQLVRERYNTDRCKSIFWNAFQANNVLAKNE